MHYEIYDQPLTVLFLKYVDVNCYVAVVNQVVDGLAEGGVDVAGPFAAVGVVHLEPLTVTQQIWHLEQISKYSGDLNNANI